MNTDIRVERCVGCGLWMNCDEIDARYEFTPDGEREWTCGPCVRAQDAEDDDE